MTRISRSRIDMEDGRVDRAVFKDYGETLVGGASGADTGSSYTIDLSQGNAFNLNLTGNCAFTFSNPKGSGTEASFTLILKQTGSFTPTWPSAVIWPSGSEPTLSALANRVHIFSFFTLNGGLRWFGNWAGDAYDLSPQQLLWTWGKGTSGQLGLNSEVFRSSPTQIGTLTNWSQIGAQFHTVAIKSDGTLWSWGYGDYGALGNNATADRSSPTQIGTLTNWSQASPGDYHTIAKKADGTLWTWGLGAQGQLGNDAATSRSSPAQVGTLTNWSQVSGGGRSNAAAVKTDGTIWTWGTGTAGRLGHNDTVTRSSPTQVGTLTSWTSLDVGTSHTIAIKTDGTLWTWGNGSYGRLGFNDTVSRSSPAQVGTLTNWSEASAGDFFSIASKTDGTLWTWGDNGFGELGFNDGVYRSSPAQVGTLTTWSQVSAGRSHTAAVKTDGTLWTWGGNAASGRLGHGDSVLRSSPTQVGTLAVWASVSAGGSHTAALSSTDIPEPPEDIALVDDGDAAPSSGAGTSTHTYSGQTSTGPDSILFITWSDKDAAGRDLTNVTWGGVAMSALANVRVDGGDKLSLGAAIYYIDGAQTGDVILSFDGVTEGSEITKASLTGLQSATPTDTDSASGTGASHSLSALASPGTGGIRLCCYNNETIATAITWTNATEIADAAAAENRHSVAYDLGDDATTITAAGATDFAALAGVSLR